MEKTWKKLDEYQVAGRLNATESFKGIVVHREMTVI